MRGCGFVGGAVVADVGEAVVGEVELGGVGDELLLEKNTWHNKEEDVGGTDSGCYQ